MIIKVKVFPVMFDNQDGSFSFKLYPSKQAAIDDFINDKEDSEGPLSKEQKKKFTKQFLAREDSYENGYHSLEAPETIEINTETQELVDSFYYSS